MSNKYNESFLTATIAVTLGLFIASVFWIIKVAGQILVSVFGLFRKD